MEENKTPRYVVATNGSKSYYQVVDTTPAQSGEHDVCTVWGKPEKADRIAAGLNLLDRLQTLPEAATKAQIVAILKAFLP